MIWIGLLLLALVLQLIFLLAVFSRLGRHRPVSGKLDWQPVSVVICALDEAAALQKNLPAVLNQDYPDFEVLVVDHDSQDNTSAILDGFARNKHFTRVFVKSKSGEGKKAALTQGIQSAKHDVLLLTDADAHPVSDQWIRKMVQPLSTHTQLVLGVSPLERNPGWLNRLIRFETFQTALQYLNFALLGWPYMGVGRNLAYSRSLYNKVGGFAGHAHLLGGDDDLFVNQAAQPGNTAICVDPEGMTLSSAKSTWTDWLHQKRRHLQAGQLYHGVHKLLLGSYIGSILLFYFSLALVFAATGNLTLVLGIYALRLLIQSAVYFRAMERLQVKDLWKWIPVLDLLYALYFILIIPLTVFKPIRTWK